MWINLYVSYKPCIWLLYVFNSKLFDYLVSFNLKLNKNWYYYLLIELSNLIYLWINLYNSYKPCIWLLYVFYSKLFDYLVSFNLKLNKNWYYYLLIELSNLIYLWINLYNSYKPCIWLLYVFYSKLFDYLVSFNLKLDKNWYYYLLI